MAHRVSLCAVLAAAAGGLLIDQPAEACGGFFCSQTPVAQSGEHLLFAVEQGSEGTVVTAHIQVQYEGAAPDFAWVLPLPSVPDQISVGSNSIFGILRQQTEPYFQINWTQDTGECSGYDNTRWFGATNEDAAGSAADGDADAGEQPPSVEVVQHEEVGPYDSVVIRSLDGDAGELVQWLEDNDYRVPDTSLSAIQSYVNAGHVFLALKLLNDRSTGDIQPVVLRLVEESPCIPLLLTAIAASPDMPIYAWILGPTGVVSVNNFLEVQLNMAAIDWFAPGYGGFGNYQAVATRAMDEAGGRGFIREYAGVSSIFANSFYTEGRYDLELLRGTQDPAGYVDALLYMGFPRDTTMQNLLRRFIPMPQALVDQGVTEQEWYNCLSCYAQYLDDLNFDPEAFTDALVESVIAPLQGAQALVDHNPYVTRLFTTISPEEMTEDPIFRFNPDVPDVANAHIAEAHHLCGDGIDYSVAPIQLTLPDGRVIILRPGDDGYPDPERYAWVDDDGDGQNDNVGVAPLDMPSLLRALRHGTTGHGDSVLDNSTLIDERLHHLGSSSASGGGLCSASPGAGSPAVLTLLGLGLASLLVVRRRRSR